MLASLLGVGIQITAALGTLLSGVAALMSIRNRRDIKTGNGKTVGQLAAETSTRVTDIRQRLDEHYARVEHAYERAAAATETGAQVGEALLDYLRERDERR